VFAGCKAGLLGLHSRRLLNLGSLVGTRANPFLTRSCRLLDLPLPEDL